VRTGGWGFVVDADDRDGDGYRQDLAADRRDEAAGQRDRAAEQRDFTAELRDDAAAERDQAAEESMPPLGSVVTPETVTRSAADRREAADDRRRSRADRGAGASDRTEAERDRHDSLADRVTAGRERVAAAIDELTGVYGRRAGLVELEREMARAHREKHPLIVAFIDVDDLKTLNDTYGHSAGDRMLRGVATTLRTRLRPYDLVLRYGGDEFLCVLPGVTLQEGARRFEEMNVAIASVIPGGSISIGLAQLTENDSAEDVIARADAALYSAKNNNDLPRPGSGAAPHRPPSSLPPGPQVFQVAYTSPARKVAHVTIANSLEDPAVNITVCGQAAKSKGDFLAPSMHLWPTQSQPWCAQCLHQSSVAMGSPGH
jgi:diguanylate cyclase (GGDEF)-like protein